MTLTKITNMEAERVDAVGSPASGLPFLLLKSIPQAPELPTPEGTEASDTMGDVLDAESDVSNSQANLDELKIDAEGDQNYADAVGLAKEEDSEGDEEIVGAESVGTPGDKAWETEDAKVAHEVARGIAELKVKLAHVRDREGTEGESDAYASLDLAVLALCDALCVVAKFAFEEGAEASLAKAVREELKSLSKSLGQPSLEKEIADMTLEEVTELIKAEVEKAIAVSNVEAKTGPAESETNAAAKRLDAQNNSEEDEPELGAVTKEEIAPIPGGDIVGGDNLVDAPVIGGIDEGAIVAAVKDAVAAALKGLEGRLDTVEKMAAPRSIAKGTNPGSPADTEVEALLQKAADPTLSAAEVADLHFQASTRRLSGIYSS